MSEKKESYQPSPEEVEKAEDMMTPEQRNISYEAAYCHLPASWIEKYQDKEGVLKRALRYAACDKCYNILAERYKKYGDDEFAFWLGSEGFRFAHDWYTDRGGNQAQREKSFDEATEILKGWEPNEDELKFFGGDYYCEE